MRAIFAAAVVGLTFWGAALAAELPSATINGFKKGETTKAQVLAALGEPGMRADRLDGGSTARYDFNGPASAAGGPKPLIVLFQFDPKGLYQGIQVYTKTDGAAATGGAPAQTASETPPLSDENIFAGVPAGFKIGSQGRNGTMDGMELIPATETVQAWSRMITIETFHNMKAQTPDGFATGMRTRWTASCLGADVQKLTAGATHGYSFSTWRFLCPSNAGKPENTVMKFIAGNDAFYVLQYAFRSELTPENSGEALGYLDGVIVCDTRLADRQCPAMKPAKLPTQ